MENNKQNLKAKRKAMMVILICIMLIVTAIGTLARYTTSVRGVGSGSVAKWQFYVNGKHITTSNSGGTFELDLFQTIKDQDGNTETNVAANKIAPGTQGEFNIEVQNASDVDASYSINFSINNPSGIPVKFSTDKITWKDTIQDLNVQKTISKSSGREDMTVYWKWDFSGSDDVDTSLGIKAQGTAPSLSVTCDLVISQED